MRFISAFLCLLITGLLTPVFAYTSETQTYSVHSFDVSNRNLVIEMSDGTLQLLHYLGNCDALAPQKTVQITSEGTLNGYHDTLKLDDLHSCKINQVELVTGMLHIIKAYNSERDLVAENEKGQRYYLIYGSECRAMRSFEKKDIYLQQLSPNLAVGDHLVMPRKLGVCSIHYLSPEKIKLDGTPVESGDRTVPSTVTSVKAAPGDGKVYVSWKVATDNIGIAYYLVSHSLYSLHPENYAAVDMPEQVKTTATHYTFSSLENDTTHFFYVLAVDTSGNVSSDWSEEVSAFPRSSIREFSPVTTSPFTITKSREGSSFVTYKWSMAGASRQRVQFDVDGEKVFYSNSWVKSYYTVSKKSEWKGKSLKLTVTTYDLYGRKKVAVLDFSF